MDKTAEKTDENEIYPYPGKTRSVVWDYFGFRKKRDVDGPPVKQNLVMETAICRKCGKSYANKGNTTNLMFHIDHEHKSDINNNTVSKPKSASVQPKISEMVAKPRFSKSKQEDANDKLLKLVVGKALPISLVKSPFFCQFAKELDERYQVPSEYELIKMLNQKKTNMEAKIRHDIQKVSDASLTHDGWTSVATDSYSAITGHFIDSQWNLKSVVLQIKKVDGPHTAVKIAEDLTACKTDWSLPTPTLVTDNAANECKAAEVLGWNRFGCYGHRINLVVKHALNEPEVNRILGKSRKLITFFHQSSSASDALLEKQKVVFSNQPEFIGHKLIIDVSTRWNSTLAMFERLTEQIPVIMNLIHEPKLNKSAVTTIKNCCLSFDEHGLVQELIQALKPFEKATVILCAEKTPTMHKVLPCLAKIQKHIDEMEPTACPVVKKVMNNMRRELCNRTSYTEEIPLMAAMLSPDTKELGFMTAEEQISAHQLLLKTACAVHIPVVNIVKEEKSSPDPETVPIQVTENNPPTKKAKLTDMDDWLDDVCFTGTSTQPEESVTEQEVCRYLAQNCQNDSKQHGLLDWWRENGAVYPRLANLAKKYLSVPASSVPSERVFSLSGNIVNKKRSRLKPSMVDTLVFLNMNMNDYW